MKQTLHHLTVVEHYSQPLFSVEPDSHLCHFLGPHSLPTEQAALWSCTQITQTAIKLTNLIVVIFAFNFLPQ